MNRPAGWFGSASRLGNTFSHPPKGLLFVK